MSNVLRSLMVKIGVDLTDAEKGLKNAAKQFKSMGKELTSSGKALTQSLTVPILGAAAAVGGLVVKSGEMADELITLSNKTGITTEALQEMEYAARFIDVEVETMTDSMVKLTRSMDAARRGTKEQEEAFAKLGVEYKNADGTLRNAKDVWKDVIDALGNISSEADRDAISLNLFGRSASELNPLIKAGSDEMERLAKEAHEVGAVIDDESIQALGKFDDEMQKIKAVLKSAGGQLATAFLPLMQKLGPIVSTKIVPAIKKFADIVIKLVDGFSKLSPLAKTLSLTFAGYAVAIGPALTAIGKLSTSFGKVLTSISGAVKTIKGGGGFMATMGSLIGPTGVIILVTVALTALVAAFASIGADSRAATARIKEFTDSLRAEADEFAKRTKSIETETGVARKLADQIFALSEKENLSNAEKSRMASLVSQLNKLMPELNLQIDAQTGSLNRNKSAVYALIDARRDQMKLEAYEERLISLYKQQLELSDELTAAQERHNKAVEEYGKWGFGAWDTADKERELRAAADALDMLNKAIAENTNQILSAESTYDGLADQLNKTMYYVGKSAASGMAAGLIDGKRAVVDAAVSVGKAASDSLKKQMQIASPSKVMIKLGQFISEGLAVGIEQSAKLVDTAVKSLEMRPAMPTAQAGSSSGASGNYTLNVNGSTDPNQVAGIVVSRLKQAGVIA